jgi:hypothetical protein
MRNTVSVDTSLLIISQPSSKVGGIFLTRKSGSAAFSTLQTLVDFSRSLWETVSEPLAVSCNHRKPGRAARSTSKKQGTSENRF